MKRGALVAALATACALLLSSCGGSAAITAAAKVPSLSAVLTKVDRSLEHHQYAAARQSLTRLITETRTAERAGTLSADSASRIISAARKLLGLVPRASTATQPRQPISIRSSSPSPSATPSPTPSVTLTPIKPAVTTTATPAAPTPTSTPTPEPSVSPTGSPSPDATPTSGSPVGQ